MEVPPSGRTDPSLCPLCPDASIFSLKEIQLQKDPGHRGSAFQQSGRAVEKPGSLPAGAGMVLALGCSQEKAKPAPCHLFSPQITPGHRCHLPVAFGYPEAQLLLQECHRLGISSPGHRPG